MAVMVALAEGEEVVWGPGGSERSRGLKSDRLREFDQPALTTPTQFSISARNLLNTFNPGPPVGNLSSQFFGQSINIAGGPFGSASANRRVDLQVRFSF